MVHFPDGEQFRSWWRGRTRGRAILGAGECGRAFIGEADGSARKGDAGPPEVEEEKIGERPWRTGALAACRRRGGVQMDMT